ncbi:MAG: hypothetical protein JKY65_28225 [Planctomycetes bacterium]|nr:hypothetical protein [Planctomycetota bacterium]
MNKKPSKGMNPVLKAGLGCCALLGLLIVLFCGGSMIWSQGIASVDGPKTTARYTETVGGTLPASVKPLFSMDTSPIPLKVVFVANAEDAKKLTLIAVGMPQSQGQPQAEHMLAWKSIVGPFAPQMQALGVSLPTAEAMVITDTGDSKQIKIEVDGKVFKGIEIPCKHTNGTELKRIYVKLKDPSGGTMVTGLFGIGDPGDFDDSAFEEALKGCTPR